MFHAGDGNLHPLILWDADVAGAEERVIDAGAEIMRVCAAAGGSLSGEHGIGMEKKDLMPLIFSQDDVAHDAAGSRTRSTRAASATRARCSRPPAAAWSCSPAAGAPWAGEHVPSTTAAI